MKYLSFRLSVCFQQAATIDLFMNHDYNFVINVELSETSSRAAVININNLLGFITIVIPFASAPIPFPSREVSIDSTPINIHDLNFKPIIGILETKE